MSRRSRVLLTILIVVAGLGAPGAYVAAQFQRCTITNDYRRLDEARWQYILRDLPPAVPGSDDALRRQRFADYIVRADARADCIDQTFGFGIG